MLAALGMVIFLAAPKQQWGAALESSCLPRCCDAVVRIRRVAAWVSSSIFLCGFKVQWNTLSRWFSNVEIDVRLFVSFGVLLSPQYQQERRKLCKDNLRPVDLRMASRTESDHQMQNRLARFPMVDARIGITAHPTGVSIAL
jgi:hypothetical protein